MLDYSQEEKEIFMSEALKEAQKSLDKAEIPIGCVIVKDKEIVGRGHNAREELNQAIMHAEVMAIQEANRTVGNWRLLDCTTKFLITCSIDNFGNTRQTNGSTTHDTGFNSHKKGAV